MDGQNVVLRKVAEHGKPGDPNRAVEFQVTVSRRQVFRFIVPFLVATIGFGAQDEDDVRHALAADSE